MKKIMKNLGPIVITICLLFFAANAVLNWLIEKYRIEVLADGSVVLPEAEESELESEPAQENESEQSIPVREEETEQEDPALRKSEESYDQDTVLAEVSQCYYYQQLPEKQQKIYRQLYQALANYETSVTVDNIDQQVILDVYQLVLADCPEFFWVTGGSELWAAGVDGQRQMDLVYGLEVRKIPNIRDQIETVVCQILDQVPEGTDYEKAKWVFEYLVKNTDYDLNSPNNQNIQSIFLNNATVCAGYSKGFEFLMQRMGIMCTYVTGYAGESHAWNLIQLDGDYYYVDVTWGDPLVDGSADFPDGSNINYAFLCCNDAIMSIVHQADTLIQLPACTALDYNYYYQRGTYYDTFNQVVVFEKAKEIFGRGENTLEMQFANEDAYRQACQSIQYDDFANQLADYYRSISGLDEVSWTYQFFDNGYMIKIVFFKE